MENIDMEKSKVYIKTDDKNRITRCEGGYTMNNIENIDEWQLIDEGYGDKYNLCQSHYFAGGLYTDDGIYRYKYENGIAVLRAEDEIEADRAELPEETPSEETETNIAVWDEMAVAIAEGVNEI